MITENVKKALAEIAGGNPFGEKITLVAATKTRTPDEINEAIAAGVCDIGENKVQEFTQKFDAVHGANRHFIGHLQTNKVKYLIGKTYLIHSLDRIELADELQKRAEKADWTANCLLEVNIGCELSKSGFSLDGVQDAYKKLLAYPNIRIEGLMAMLPLSDDTALLFAKAVATRQSILLEDGSLYQSNFNNENMDEILNAQNIVDIATQQRLNRILELRSYMNSGVSAAELTEQTNRTEE